MINTLMIGLGGFIGTIFRYYITILFRNIGYDTLYSVLLVNCIGSFIAGIVLVSPKEFIGFDFRSVILIGFLGSLTTFSTFSLETFIFINNGKYMVALLNIFANIALTILMVYIGYKLSYFIFGR